jgi:raffinose/stachyose/melibiose transport system substrate-binding protein
MIDRQRKRIIILCLIASLLIHVVACKKEPVDEGPTDVSVTAVEIQGSKNISVGTSTAYRATVLPDNATNVTVTWSVISRGGQAEIDQNGELTATQAGPITIRATAVNGIYAELRIAILNTSIPVERVTIIGLDRFTHGDRATYQIEVEPENATYSTVEWDVIAGLGNVNDSGRLAAKSAGALTLGVKVDGVSGTKQITIDPYDGDVSDLKVLLNRVDLRNTVLRDYENEFEALYPMYDVTFETLLDYENNARMRLIGGDYGDVLLIPSSVSPRNLPYYFRSLGHLDELSQSWRYVGQKTYEDEVYGLPTYGNVNGILYNKDVFNEAGIDELPTTTEDFIEAMQTIKATYQNDPDFIAPYYTNKKDSWPLDQWQGNVSSVSGDPNYYYNELPEDRHAFSPGSPHYIVYKMLYDLVDQNLIENDPSTTNWERSKVEFVKGNIGAMVIGSWAVSQFVDVAKSVRDGTFEFDDGTPGEQSDLADPAHVGYMPFPHTHTDGNVYSAHSADFFMGISKHSDNPTGANDFLMWFLRESGYYELTGGIPPRTDMDFPPVIESFQELGVVLFEERAAQGDMIGKLELVEADSGIILWNPDWKRDLFEDAFFDRRSYDDIANELNTSWQSGIDSVG